MIPHMKTKIVFIRKKQKQKIIMADKKKAVFPAPPILNIFSRKFGPLVSRID